MLRNEVLILIRDEEEK